MDNTQISIIIAVIVIAVAAIVLVIKQPQKVKEWLVYAVSVAEEELGGGTGPFKLLKVYNMFVERYPVFKVLVSYETFKGWVNLALEKMEEMLEKNNAVKNKIKK